MKKTHQLTERISFNQNENILSSLNSSQKLEPKEADILLLLIQANGAVVSKEELLNCWPTGINTSDNSLTRVISTLRKKLNSFDDDTLGIFVVVKKGYQLKYQVIEESEAVSLPTVKKYVRKGPKVTSVYFISLLLLIATFTGMYSLSDTDEKATVNKNINFSVFFEDSTRKYEIAPSPDSNFILYSAQRFDEDNWMLGLFNTEDGGVRYSQKEGVSFSSPVWFDNNTILYKSVSSNDCSIMLATVDGLLFGQSSEIISKCALDSPIFSMVRFSTDEILVSDSQGIGKGSQLTLININSGQSKLLNTYDPQGVGVYKLVSSPNNNIIMTLTSSDWITTKISLYEKDNLKDPVWEINKPIIFLNVALSDRQFDIKSELGGFERYYFDDVFNLIDVEYIPTMNPISYPVYSKQGTMFNKGEIYSTTIQRFDKHTGIKQTINNTHGVKHLLPQTIDENEVWYVSTKTGIPQIWSYSFKSGFGKQISQFDSAVYIESLKLNFDHSLVALSITGKIHVYNVNNIKSGKQIGLFDGIYPEFHYYDIVYSRNENDTYQLFKYYISDSHSEQLTERGGLEANVYNGDIYYTKYNKLGIWQYNKNAKEALIFTPPVRPQNWFVQQGSIYTVGNRNELSSINLNDFTHTQINEPNCDGATYLNETFCISVIEDNIPNMISLMSNAHNAR